MGNMFIHINPKPWNSMKKNVLRITLFLKIRNKSMFSFGTHLNIMIYIYIKKSQINVTEFLWEGRDLFTNNLDKYENIAVEMWAQFFKLFAVIILNKSQLIWRRRFFLFLYKGVLLFHRDNIGNPACGMWQPFWYFENVRVIFQICI